MRRQASTIPSLLGILALVGGLMSGVYLVESGQRTHVKAETSTTPQSVRITNQGDKTATISWLTNSQTVGTLVWKKEDEFQRITTQSQSESRVHHIALANLEANTAYQFTISSEGKTYDNNGLPWEFSTGPSIANTTAQTVSGNIIDSLGFPLSNAIVYASLPGGLPQSTLTTSHGTWVIPISLARSTHLSSFVDLTGVVEIVVVDQTGKTAFARAYVASANPMPTLAIGETKDFTKSPTGQNNTKPAASLVLPEKDSDP